MHMQACRDFWQQGRQTCGALSLTGCPCILSPPSSQELQPQAAPAVSSLANAALAARPDVPKAAEQEALVPGGSGHQHSSGVTYVMADASGMNR